MYMRKLTQQVVNDFDGPVANTKQGALRGVRVENTYIFRGVKYAEAKRFRFPTEPKSWTGIKRAENFGTVCATLNVPYVPDVYRVPHYFYPESEDCLYLNIWTKSLRKEAKRPVMVWLHGGGWFSGHSMEVYSYDGENLSADKDVVVVSLNHRLHILGYLDLSAYGEEYALSGCAGVADIVAALRWIHDNIENFGGDPDNVTIFGQSGGGDKVVSVMQTPEADGLYHKAILESGGVSGREDSPAQVKAAAQELAALVLERLKLTPDRIREIDNMDWYDLATGAAEALWVYEKRHGHPYEMRPVPNQNYFQGHPYAVGFRKETGNIPMMVGHCFGENCNNFDFKIGEGHKNNWSEEYKLALIRDYIGPNADECIAQFRKAYPEKNLADILYMSRRMRRDCIKFCKLRAESASAPVWNWMFNLEAPFMNGTVAWHNAEEPYVFRNAAYIESQYEPGVSERVEDAVSGAWAAFAEKSDPNYPDGNLWGPVTGETVPTMLFDRECRVAINHDKLLLESYVTPDAGSVHTEFNAAINGVEPRD